MTDSAVKTPRPRGFAAMSPERRTEIARLGGAAVDASKRSFSAKPGLAKSAGAIGGAVSRRPKKDRDAG